MTSPPHPHTPWSPPGAAAEDAVEEAVEAAGHPVASAAGASPVAPLRPLGVGQLLDGGARAVRLNPTVMLGCAALAGAITVSLLIASTMLSLDARLDSLGSTTPDRDPVVAALQHVGLASPAGLATFAVHGVVSLVLSAILVRATADALIGRRDGVSGVLRRIGWRCLGRLMATCLVVTVVWRVVRALWVLATTSTVLQHRPEGGRLLLTLAAVLVLLAVPGVRLALLVPVVVLEGARPRQAFRRSWRLVGGSWWRTFAVLALCLVIAGAANLLLSLPFSAAGFFVTMQVGLPTSPTLGLLAGSLVIGLGQVVVAAVTAPFVTGVLTLLYVDLRVRRKGLDATLARAVAQGSEPWP